MTFTYLHIFFNESLHKQNDNGTVCVMCTMNIIITHSSGTPGGYKMRASAEVML